MITLNDDLLENLQLDVTERLRSVAWFADVTVLMQTKGDVEAEVAEALGTLHEKSGKYGLVAVVILPSAESAEANIPGPRLELKVKVQVIEAVLMNRGAEGTGKTASQGALRVLNALHHFVAHDRGVMVADRSPVVPVPTEDHLQSYAAQLTLQAGLCGTGKVNTPEFVQGAQISITTTTPGAEIYYTTDGSYPSPENVAASKYANPLTPDNMKIRAAAYLDGLMPSDVQVAVVEV